MVALLFMAWPNASASMRPKPFWASRSVLMLRFSWGLHKGRSDEDEEEEEEEEMHWKMAG